MKSHILLLVIIYICGIITLGLIYILGINNYYAFVIFYLLFFLFNPPKDLISPATIVFLYYGLWFVIAPTFAERYIEVKTSLPEYSLAFLLLFITYGSIIITMEFTNHIHIRKKDTTRKHKEITITLIYSLYITSTLLIIAIVLSSGGFSRWIADPGDAFLNRAGSGVYVILSHFSSMALALLSGYYAYRKKKHKYLFYFIIWVFLTSPVHGSKGQISTLLLLSLIPWLRNIQFFSKSAAIIITLLTIVFFMGLYFRNHTWIDIDTLLPYALNYFTTLENLAVSLRDFEPEFMQTFHLPFMKFLTPFGLSDSVMYYDMNHWLTDIYHPTAWEIRATEQWPVETDLYLNFYFLAGIPVLSFYIFIISYIYKKATIDNSLGIWFAAILLTLLLPSHLRGSLINHTDFYLYPYIFLMYLLFKRTKIS